MSLHNLPVLERLRHAPSIARVVLAWLLLSIGAAAASSWVAPQAVHLVCTAQGVVKLVAVDQDGGAAGGTGASHGAECALCLPFAAPAPAASLEVAAPPASGLRVAIPRDTIVSRRPSAAPPPARGPPSLS